MRSSAVRVTSSSKRTRKAAAASATPDLFAGFDVGEAARTDGVAPPAPPPAESGDGFPIAPCGLRPGPPPPPGFYAGTCAFQHADWNNHFYPRGTAARGQLPWYSRFCNAVEIDSSFYRPPTRELVQRWASETPEGFLFALKAPKSLTHDGALRLDDPEAARDWDQFVSACEALGPRLGAILLQLAPRIRAHSAPLLERILGLASAMPIAVEFRHDSWNTSETDELLAHYGAVRAWTDAYLDRRRPRDREAPHTFPATGPFRYIRLLGDVSTKYDGLTGERVLTYKEVLFDRTEDLEFWAARIRRDLKERVKVLVFGNNHYQGFSPQTVQELRRRVAEPPPG